MGQSSHGSGFFDTSFFDRSFFIEAFYSGFLEKRF
jgi:hypothetical protein